MEAAMPWVFAAARALHCRVMRIFLYGISSLSYWLSAYERPASSGCVGAEALRDCDPTARSVSHLEVRFPQIPQPYHVLLAARRRRALPGTVRHVSVFPYTGKPFCRVGDGVYVSCPELCFVQLACSLGVHELVKVGDALCGTFAIDPAARHGLGERRPLTTVRRIRGFIQRNPGLPGVGSARAALDFVSERAASPPESFLRMVLGLPYRLGGYQINGLRANQRLRPSRRAQAIAGRSTLVPDLHAAEARLSVEYDSNAEHLTERQIGRDAAKRLALEADGYKVVTVTKLQLSDPAHMRRVAVEVGRRMGRRVRPQSRRFHERNRALFRAGWSLRAYHRGEWLVGSDGSPARPSAVSGVSRNGLKTATLLPDRPGAESARDADLGK